MPLPRLGVFAASMGSTSARRRLNDRASNAARASTVRTAARSSGTTTSRGASSTSISTSTSSPPDTPAASRFSALSAIMNRPWYGATELR